MRNVLLALALLAPTRLWAVELAFNCGGDARVVGARSFAADRPYGPTSGSGYVGGEAARWPLAVAVGGTSDKELFRDWREGERFAYWFDVADGRWAVTLHLAEMEPAFPGSRRMSVSIEGKPVAGALDVAAVAGRQYALPLRYLATVADGRLEVVVQGGSLEGRAATAFLSAIEVTRLPDVDLVPPAPPQGLATHPGFGATMLRWTRGAEPDLLGYLVSRRDATLASGAGSGLVTTLTRVPSPLARFVDGGATGPATYTVRAVDLSGNRSDPVEIQAPAPLPVDGGPLPRIDLELDDANLAFLLGDPFRDIAAHGRFREGNVDVMARIRNRGRSTRYFGKPGLKVILEGGARTAGGGRRLNLKAEPASSTLLEERLALDLFRRAGSLAPSPRPVRLRINGQEAGLYLDVEQVDGAFLDAAGFQADSPVWKVADFQVAPDGTFRDSLLGLVRDEGTPADDETVRQLVAELATVNEGDLDDWLEERWDVDELVAFLAAAAVTANNFDGSSYYVAMDRGTGRFSLVPWDLNNRAFGMEDPSRPPSTDDALLPNAMQGLPPDNARFSLLFTRVLHAPRTRRLLADRIHALAAFAAGPEHRDHVRSAHDEVAAAAVADIRKKGWEDPAWFLAGPARFELFLSGRQARLEQLLPGVREPRGALALAEIAVTGAAGVVDEAGEQEPWIEIVNRTGQARDLGGSWITNDLRDRRRFRLPAGLLVPAWGRVVVWADGEPAEGPLHASFRLDPHGGGVAISSDVATLDHATYGAQIPGVTYGREAALEDRWSFLATATPGAPNHPARHVRRPVTRVFHVPAFPEPGEPVTVLARVEPGELQRAFVVAGSDGRMETQPLVDDGAHGDGAAGDGLYGARLSLQAAGARISYYVEADYAGAAPTILRSPSDAPASTHGYRVATLVPPRLFINEVVPSNRQGATDEAGQHSDWVEIWNGDAVAIDLSGMYLSDNPAKPRKWMFPESLVLPPGGRTLVWLDGAIDEGNAHASFRLKSGGDQLLLTHRHEAGAILIDRVDLGAVASDVAWARCPDGGPLRQGLPTPGRPNAPCMGP